MSGKSPVRQADLIYGYDGTLAGFYSCVFESFVRREIPFAIWAPKDEQPALCPVRQIPTDPDRAARVRRAVRSKLSAGQTVEVGFLSGQEDKELILLRFLHYGFGAGPGALHQLGRSEVADACRLSRQVLWEVEKWQGFVRFEESGGMLGAVIHPKNHVLPLLGRHFCSRMPEEAFLIYDAVHREALVHQHGQARILRLSAPLDLPRPSQKESDYQRLWKRFYDTLAIDQRRNERCRRTHCPKRFWADMTELRDPR